MRNPLASNKSSMTAWCSKVGIKRGPWTPEEDEVLSAYIGKEGEGRWRTLPKRAGLQRCGKSCRLRWMNYLRPDVKRGHIAPDEEDLILRLHRLLGNRWSLIAGRIPGRTDNEIKNYWNTHLSKKLINQGIDPRTHKPLENTTTIATTPPDNSADQVLAAPYNPKPNPNYSSQELQEASSSHQAAKPNTNDPNPNPNPNMSHQLYEYGHTQPAGAVMGGTKNWVDDDHNYMCNEDLTFSSFLDTLMNDQAPAGFVAHHGHQLQQPISLDQGSFWEAELIMRSTMETLAAGDMQNGFNNINDHHHHHHTS